ncbi:MAG: dockerin type I repeat-containing protein [Phycisphaerae bacterium]
MHSKHSNGRYLLIALAGVTFATSLPAWSEEPHSSGDDAASQAVGDDYLLQLDCDPDDVTPPEIDHERMCSDEKSTTYSGYIDPRRESDNGTDLNQGIDSFTLIFTEPVFDVGNTSGGWPYGVLTTASFSVTETGGREPPNVVDVSVDLEDPTIVFVEFDRIIRLQEWTTVIADLEDACGNRIPTEGSLGPGVDETDRVDVGFLPGEVNQDGRFNPLDVTRFRQFVNGVREPPCLGFLPFIDINRNGSVNPLDLTALRHLAFRPGPCTPPGGCLYLKMNHDQP